MGNNPRVHRLTPLAEADLEEIWEYTFREWSLEQADEYLRRLMETIEGLASGRVVGQQCDARAGYWKCKVGAHVVYFRCPDGFLDVVRVLHGRMDVDGRL